MAFRSGLEERIADLLVELGVKYEHEYKGSLCNPT